MNIVQEIIHAPHLATPIDPASFQEDIMSIGKFIQSLLIIYLASVLTACGGSGGAGNSVENSASSQPGSSSSSSQASSTAQLQAFSRINTPIVVSNYLDLLLFAKDTAATIVNGAYNTGIADGTYKDSCEGGKGSFELKVSNNGNLLVQQYSNCVISITEDGVTDKLLISGEESISTKRNENTPSIVNISWKNYSISTNGVTALALDGSFIYEGLLNFNREVNYINITSRIKINARISDEVETINTEGVEFVVDFPAIFDRYGASGFGYNFEPEGLHVFTKKIIVAKGSLSAGQIKTDFNLDTSNSRITFSNSATAKSYLDATANGFFIKWDENSDGLIDANVFLSESEYPVISDHLLEQNTNIYFTRYPNQYGTPLPPGHFTEGKYNYIELSKGASIEINVQELFTNKSGALLTYEINNQSASADWEQLEAGRFKLLFPNSNGYETYELNITAVDSNNNRSPIITATIRMNDNLADTDKDGILDIDDPDIDNDGIANGIDRFPKDPTESADLDWDGIGDNSDGDQDNDGIANTDDHFPKDINCYSADAGDDYGCYLNLASYAFNDGNSTVYLLQTIRTDGNPDKVRFIRFDTNTHQFLAPSPILDARGGYVYTNAFNPSYNSVLMQDILEEKLSLINLDDFSIKVIRSTDGHYVYPHFSEHGYFAVYISEDFTTTNWTEIFDHNGDLVDSNKTESLANPTYYLASSLQKNESVPFCKFSVSLSSSGQLVTIGDEAQKFDDICSGTNSTSQNLLYTFADRLYAGPRAIYDKEGTTLAEVNGEQMQWLDNTLVYIDVDSYHNTGSFDLVVNDFVGNQVQRYKDENNHLETIYVVGKKIISFQSSAYNAPAKLMVFDKELTVEFDSADK